MVVHVLPHMTFRCQPQEVGGRAEHALGTSEDSDGAWEKNPDLGGQTARFVKVPDLPERTYPTVVPDVVEMPETAPRP